MRTYFFSSLRHYLWGSFDQAIEQIEAAVSAAENGGYENWHFYTTFFKARLFFELGRYHDAEKILADCLLRNECYRDPDRYKLFSAWAARACIFQGKAYRGITMLKTLKKDPEVLMFTAEGYYFKRELQKATECIEHIEDNSDYFEPAFNSNENISWKNGFTALEERFLRTEEGSGILLHNIKSLYALFTGLSGNREFGIEILYSLTRDQKISENDPFNRIYFYFYSQLIDSRHDLDSVDKLTIMSKALKYLQQTSSRINNPGIRQEYMNKNFWNSRLSEEARREKLL
jgi:tetratricopeptide (TPR) repeat protein